MWKNRELLQKTLRLISLRPRPLTDRHDFRSRRKKTSSNSTPALTLNERSALSSVFFLFLFGFWLSVSRPSRCVSYISSGKGEKFFFFFFFLTETISHSFGKTSCRQNGYTKTFYLVSARLDGWKPISNQNQSVGISIR